MLKTPGVQPDNEDPMTLQLETPRRYGGSVWGQPKSFACKKRGRAGAVQHEKAVSAARSPISMLRLLRNLTTCQWLVLKKMSRTP